MIGPGWQRVDGFTDRELHVRVAPDANGRKLVVGLHLDGGPVTADLLRSLPIGRIENMLNVDQMDPQFLTQLPPLRRQRGQDPDEFMGLVASYYRYFSTLTTRPVKRMADHAGVPLPTAHGWVREARLRGELPPGHQGKATA